MPSREPRVGIVVLHWNKIDETKGCLQSLLELSYQNFQVFLIDNGSEIPLESLLEARHSNVVVVRSNENVGFAAGCNIGINASLKDGCEFVWLLNNDAIADRKALHYLVKKADEVPTAGILGSTILEQSNRKIINHMGGKIKPYSGLCIHLEKGNPYPPLQRERDISPSYVTGCSMLARVKMIQTVGLLDEGYFLYWEDADWCVRARRIGWDIAIATESEVFHEGSSSLGPGSPLKSYYLARNSLRCTYRLYPWLYPLAFIWWPRRHFVNHIFRGRFQHARMGLRGLVDFFLQRAIVPETDQNNVPGQKPKVVRLG